MMTASTEERLSTNQLVMTTETGVAQAKRVTRSPRVPQMRSIHRLSA